MVASIALNCAHFNLSNHVEAYALDGQQHLYVSQLSAMRASTLDAQWVSTNEKSNSSFGTIGNIILIFKLTAPLIKIGCNYLQQTLEFTAINLSSIVQILEKGINKVLDYAGPILNIACAVSYVAMITLGHTLIGAFGIAGLALIAIKRYGYMPGYIETILTPVEYLSLFYTALTNPQNIVFKALHLISVTLGFLNYITTNEYLIPYLPDFLTNGSPGEHIISPERHLASIIDAKDLVMTILEKTSNFELNYSALHAKETNAFLPEDVLKDLEQISFETLFTQIEQECTQLKLTKNEAGWKRLKGSIINDRCTDVRPPNFDKFRIVFKALLSKIVNDKLNFGSKVQELAETGTQCTEGWLRAINVMLNPKSKDVKWSTHYKLATLRGELINEQIGKLEQTLKASLPKGFEFSLNVLGGSNNIHLSNQCQAGLWHRWRPYGGAVHLQIKGRNIFERILHRNLRPKLSTPMFDFEAPLGNLAEKILTIMEVNLPLPIPPDMFLDFINTDLLKTYTPELLIKYLYEKIKPEYRIEENCTVCYRDIAWKPIQEWLSDISQRNFNVFKTNDQNAQEYNASSNVSTYYDPRIVDMDDYDEPHLTEEGVRLFLWDLGIIQTKECLSYYKHLNTSKKQTS
ncbi:MAG: hypothetical protein P4L16_01400 [Chlamydiales bacterium]|nr:hypothetical protein [Chlamydiales bacterium]